MRFDKRIALLVVVALSVLLGSLPVQAPYHTTTTTTTTNPQGDFTITATPSLVAVSPGDSASYTVTASPTGGFSGSVTLSASTSPPSSEITTSFSKETINPRTVSNTYTYTYPDSSTLTVTTSSNVAVDTYTITVKGTSGSLSHSTSVTLQVSTQATTTTTQPTGQAPSIVVKSAPGSVAAPGELLTFTWEVTGAGSISHTAVHWDTKPGNPTDFESYQFFTFNFADMFASPDQAPKSYAVSFDAPNQAGTIYYVLHAIVNDLNIYNSDGERTIAVTAATTTTTTPATTAPATTVAAAPGVDPLLISGVVAVIVIAAVAAVMLRRR